MRGGAEIAAAIDADLARGPRLSYVNSDRGITNLHVPSDVIVDASMPALIRNGGKLWGVDGAEDDTLAVIPDSSYAGVYQTVIDDVIANGRSTPRRSAPCPTSDSWRRRPRSTAAHDKTFEIAAPGIVQVVDSSGEVLIEHEVGAGDIWRATQTKHIAVMDWVKLAVARARATGDPAVFWLDANRSPRRPAHREGHQGLALLDTSGIQITILSPEEATRYTLARMRHGLDTISVTGQCAARLPDRSLPDPRGRHERQDALDRPAARGRRPLRDGAGGSAPKHVQQLIAEDFLPWDSLGDFFALSGLLRALRAVHRQREGAGARRDPGCRDRHFLENDRSPGRAPVALDNRGSHFYLALYWAQELAAQTKDTELAATFAPVADALAANEETIVQELLAVEGSPVDLGGYYHPAPEKVAAVMRPSATLNRIVDAI